MKYIWLDCDPGHDDATAIMLALHTPTIKLLGISTVQGNAPADCTFFNALRCLHAFGADPSIKVYAGATKPLIRNSRHDSEIHGTDGLGGVVGLPDRAHPALVERQASTPMKHAIEAMAEAVREVWKDGKGEQVSILSTGPMTNVALFVSVYPGLLPAVEQFVFMGGAVGMGNRSAVAEYNILCDPEAAQVILDVPVKKTMMPINVTHTAIVTREIHAALLTGSLIPPRELNPSDPLPLPKNPLRNTLSTLISYFAAAYKAVFGFNAGPPLHDALTVAYVAHPEFFKTTRSRVDVELSGTHTSGETVVDIWNYRKTDDTWGHTGKNCLVAKELDVEKFFEYFLGCVDRCDRVHRCEPSTFV